MKMQNSANDEFSTERLEKIEKFSRIRFPEAYKKFLQSSNGGAPEENVLKVNDGEYVVEMFLNIVNHPDESQYGDYDIAVVLTQIEDRLTDNLDLLGNELIPIAALFAGDFVCLDYRNSDIPCISIWDHENSDEFEPCTQEIADSFESFIDMLTK